MTFVIVLFLSLSGGTPTAAQAPPPLSTFLLDEARELALARSAAPPAITDKAGFYVLRATGAYELVTPSKNGFHCLVQRSFTVPTSNATEFYQPRLVAPICFNAEASATLMQRDFFITTLVGQGRSLPDIRNAETAAYESGRLKYPSRTAIGYMFSSAHWLGEAVGAWHPHVMVWAPGFLPTDLVPAETGSFGVHSGLPIMDIRYGLRQPLIAIPIGKAIDPVYVR